MATLRYVSAVNLRVFSTKFGLNLVRGLWVRTLGREKWETKRASAVMLRPSINRSLILKVKDIVSPEVCSYSSNIHMRD
jgi:hypothetical protein